MDEVSVSSPARTVTTPTAPPLEAFAEAIEKELARLAVARPHLEDRICRAAQQVVVHLSSPAGTRPVRCRIRKGGRCVVLVESLSSRGAVYEVSSDSWRCSCPDAHGRNDACKHSLAAWVLWRASLSRAVGDHVRRLDEIDAHAQGDTQEADEDDRQGAGDKQKGCSACDRGWVFIGEEIVDPGTGEVAEVINPTRCRRCGSGLTHDFVQRWLESQRWIFARSRAENPHEYCLRRNAGDEATFERIVEHIRELGPPTRGGGPSTNNTWPAASPTGRWERPYRRRCLSTENPLSKSASTSLRTRGAAGSYGPGCTRT